SGGEDGESDMVDIREMVRLLEGTIDQDVISNLKLSLGNAVIKKYENRDYGLGGLSVYYPFFNKEGLGENLQTYAAINMLPNYTGYITDFAAELQKPRIWRSRSAAEVREDDVKFRLAPEEVAEAAQIKLTTWQRLQPLSEIELQPQSAAYIQVGETAEVLLNSDYSLFYTEELYRLNGHFACLYSDSANQRRRTIPAQLNGSEANLIALRDTPDGNWRIVGAVPTTNGAFNTVDKKLVRIKDGDRLALRYYLIIFGENGDIDDQRQDERWHVGEEFTVQGGLKLEAHKKEAGELSRKVNLIDYRNNNHFIRI
ncbi:MAG: hypothetical protein FWD96_05620, partial [Defluviitaleaceae bacterium]|nr:hypothetical protein [Defluviitaleaceae bacterium]